MWSRIAKRTTTTDGCTKSKNTYNRHFKNNSFLGDKTKNKALIYDPTPYN